MSTTTRPSPLDAVTDIDSARPDGAQAGALPVLAVDLVSDPSVLDRIGQLAQELERSGVGALTLSDGGLHPIHVASYLAPLTDAIALLPRTDAIYAEPFHLATQLMSLDHLSHGRAGWLLTAETDPAAAAAVGRTALGPEATAQEAADVLEAARLIWDSWAEDAVVRDTDLGVYVDAARLQYADFEGESFSVRGPAITPRSPQGLLPVLVADADRATVGERVATELADGRVLDLDVSTGARPDAVAAAVKQARTDGDGPAVRLVRLVGLDLDADPLGTVTELAAALRDRGLIAAAPPTGQSLRDQLGLPAATRTADPTRRSDRARLTTKDHV
ncbi:LLM class flavin-dependent oxidoreductase [Brachybacterium paraconglomeratum]|uniref:LLM class flavin-dependent oxidoreductase n=1 Tax=Brachybacterium paraconglomeratum TaxID=173362 RepID=UPI0031EB5D3D